MTMPIQSSSSSRAGLCPHGLPPSACPICSEGGGMGAGRMQSKPVAKPARPSGEWSYMKCYAAGMAIKAKEARAENAKTTFERQIEFAKQLHQNIQNIADKIQKAIQNIQNISPLFVQRAINVLNQVIIQPLLNLISQIPKLIEKIAEFQQKVGTMLLQAGEKLTAILGDLKNFISTSVVNGIKRQVKKIFMFLFSEDNEDENLKNEDSLFIFKPREITKYIAKIFKVKKEKEEDADRSIEKG